MNDERIHRWIIVIVALLVLLGAMTGRCSLSPRREPDQTLDAPALWANPCLYGRMSHVFCTMYRVS